MKTVYFITHPEVVIYPAVPVPRWPLSVQGLARVRLLLRQPWIGQITAVYCSTEQKAIDGASLLAVHRALPVYQVAELGENDRSATGYLPAPEFERVVDQFFAHPAASIRGWEPAAVAQQRIVRAVAAIIAQDTSSGSIAIVAHGGVGTLLLCALAGYAIDRGYEQPGKGGGNYYAFDAQSRALRHGWRPIDTFA
jgi:broad specificity phosphatase PhoE